MAKANHSEITPSQANEIWSRILDSFAWRPEGRELADGFVALIRYFSQLGFWRGYKNAKRNYQTLNAIRRTPRGREKLRLVIEQILEKEIDSPAEKICQRLDDERLSESFFVRTGGKQRIVTVGPFRGKMERSWVSMCRENCVKGMISRIRTRLRKERTADAWMKLAERASSPSFREHFDKPVSQ